MIYFLFSFLMFLVPLIWFPKTSEVFEFNKMVLVYAFTILTTTAWFLKMLEQRKIIFRRTILDIPLLLFFASQIISTIFSIDPRISILGYYSRFHGGLLSTFCYLLLYWTYVSNIKPQENQRILRNTLVSATIVGLWAGLEHFGFSLSCLLISQKFNVDCWVQNVQERVFASLGQPNWLAAWLVALLPLTWNLNLLGIGLGTLFYLVVLFTKSRSGLIAFALAFLVYWSLTFYFQRSKIKTLIKPFSFITGLILLASLVFGTPWTPSLAEQINQPSNHQQQNQAGEIADTQLEPGGTESGEIRKIVWQGALEIWKNHPLFGTGPETFAFTYWQYRPAAHNLTSEWDYIYNKAHNEYLNILANTGLIGLSTYLLLIGLTIVQIVKPVINRSANKSTPINLALLAGYLSLLVTNFFGFSVVVVALLFFLYPAFAAVSSPSDKDLKFKTELKVKIPKIFLFLLAGYLMLLTVKYWYADTLYARALKENKLEQVQNSISLLDQALNIAPHEPLYHNELAKTYTRVAIVLAENNEASSAAKLADAAQQESDLAVSLSPRNVSLRKSRASIFLDLVSIDPDYILEAVKELERLTVYAPTDARNYYLLGATYLKINEKQKAQEMLNKALVLKPNYREVQELLENF